MVLENDTVKVLYNKGFYFTLNLISVQSYLRRMMTRKWLNDDEDFKQLYSRTEQLSKHCDLMRPPHVQVRRRRRRRRRQNGISMPGGVYKISNHFIILM